MSPVSRCLLSLICLTSWCNTHAAAQQSASGCPVQITGINPSGDDSFGHAFVYNTGYSHDNDDRMFVLKAKNTSGKDIRGMRFQAAYFDATEDITDIPVSWEWTDPLKADAEKSFRWENSWREQREREARQAREQRIEEQQNSDERRAHEAQERRWAALRK